MTRELLQNIISNISYDDLPATWNSFDLRTFSQSKSLYDYQQIALRYAILALKKYYEDFADYERNELSEINQQRKSNFYRLYLDNNLPQDFDIELERRRSDINKLLSEYYPSKGGIVSFQHFVNRMCFWMATGSGKSLVLVKLIQILRDLIKRGEIPPNDILILTHRDDLIEQIKHHVHEFNLANEDIFIKLHELKSYEQVKRGNPSLFRDKELTVFYYRSDNLSDEHFDKIIDFKNYDNDGQWYIFLDEAHKGDREDSKRQHIYSILSRNGFLFNFSATFTDERDLAATVFNFNLAEFIKAGYGKHIAILEQEFHEFRGDDDYTEEEKQKIVLKSLIMLTYVRKFAKQIKDINAELYHNPLMLTLVNSVNVEDADLKLFFRELEKIGKGKINQRTHDEALRELAKEFGNKPSFVFEENTTITFNQQNLVTISKEDILQNVFNAEKPADIEVIVRPSNRQELAFRLKSSTKPFALIKIGDVSGWLKEELSGYEVQERFEEESYFEALNSNESDITILMGSRSFYEGWDSNRPNVINYINIGTGEDARKFILQSVGRGVRIEPIKNKRKRLQSLFNADLISQELYTKVKALIEPLESLFIFGTNRLALKTVIEKMKSESGADKEKQLSLFVNPEAGRHPLLIPVYKKASKPTIEEIQKVRFEISRDDLSLVERYTQSVSDKILLMRHRTEPMKVEILIKSLKHKEKHFSGGDRTYSDPDLLVQRIFDYYDVVPEEFQELKLLEDEIRHFKDIKVDLKILDEVQNGVDVVTHFQDPNELKINAKEKFESKEITLEEYTKEVEKAAKAVKEKEVTYNNKRLIISHLAQHYYLPMMISEDEKIDFINHVIKVPSEIKFIKDLQQYLDNPENKFKEFDWWMFSKLDESMDEVYIPYYNPGSNHYSKFKPDFIFWLQKNDQYHIVFVDPKGTEHMAGLHKINGYKTIFEFDKQPIVFLNNNDKVKILLRLRAKDIHNVPPEYQRFWFDEIDLLFENTNGK